tara:strand:+ start:1867 stop:3009 length:1143 start_codon:yes stop_codon:yes gene_type:complete
MEENKETIGGFEVFSSPEELSASMNAESQQTETVTEEAPQQESQVVSEPTEQVTSEPQVETTSEPQVEQQPENDQVPQVSQEEFTQQQPAEVQYSDNEIENAVMSYLSEKLDRDITSLDDLYSQPTPMDERVEAIAKFVSETGRAPKDWFTYQSLSTSEMDDATLVKVDMALQYPNLSAEEVNTLILNKYKLDPNKYSEDEVKVGSLQMKVDAANAKKQIEEQRMRYAAPEVQQQPAEEQESFIDEEWISEMRQEANDLTGLEFDLGNDKTFTFGLDDRYKQDLVNKNARLDEYFDAYVRDDGSWDFDTLNSHRAIIDNIDAIVASTYRQGLSDGQKGVVQNAANVSAQVPQQSSQPDNPLGEQLKNILGKNSNKMTFKI